MPIFSQGSGNTLTFDGSNDYVNISDNAALDIQEEITIEFWFFLEGNSGNNDYARTVSKGQSTTTNGAYGVFVRDVSNPTDIGMRFIDATNTIRDIRSTSVPNYDDGEWHHVAAVYSNSQDAGFLYVDGLEEAAVSITGNTQIRTTADDLTIGTGNLQRYFNGRLDEVRIWNVARTQQQIREYMCAKLDGTETGLVGYWNLDDAALGAGNVPDLTSNSLDGTMTNMDAVDVDTSGAPIGDESIHIYPQNWGGNAINFDGSNDYINVGDVLIDGLSAITIEAWIYPQTVPVNVFPSGHNSNEGAIVHKSGSSDDNLGLTVASGGLAFYLDNGNDNTLIGSLPSLNTWTHVVATYDGSNLSIYQDGVLDVSQASIGSGAFINNTNNLRFGGGHTAAGSPHEFDGFVNEIRIWNYARTDDEIQNDMCRPLQGNENGLVGYWRFDELANSSTATDDISGNDGSLTNMDPATDWVDADHSCSYLGLELTMTSVAEDSFMVSNVIGNPEGIHIYHVNEPPNTNSGISGFGDNDAYYGVWKAEGTGDIYTGTYFFRENDAWVATNPQIEVDLLMFSRSSNSESKWSLTPSVLDPVANTLTAVALSTEFAIGLSSGVLPVELLDFTARPKDDMVRIEWQTASEVNNDYFEVERSIDTHDWDFVFRESGAGNSIVSRSYNGSDPSPIIGSSYYRLKQVDFDGTFTYSQIEMVHFNEKTQRSLYPNPASEHVYISGLPSANLRITNALGIDMTSLTSISNPSHTVQKIGIERLPPGTYIIHLEDAVYRVVKQ